MGVSYSSQTGITRIAQQLLEQLAARRQDAILQDDRKNEIILWLGTARALVRAGRGSELRLWLAMHHLARQAGGPGWVHYDRPTLDRLAGLTGCAVLTIRQLLKKQGADLWTLKRDVVALAGQERVSTDLGVLELETRIGLPADCLSAGLASFEAFVFAAWVGRRGEHGVNLVWDDLSALWGKSRGQLRRWFETAGIHKTPKRAYEHIPGIRPDELAEMNVEPQQLGYNHGKLIAYKGEVYWTFKRANTLRCAQDYRTARGGKALSANRRKTGRAGQHGSAAATKRGHGHTPGIEPGLNVDAGKRPSFLDDLQRRAAAAPRRRIRNFRSWKAFHTFNRKYPERDAFWRAWRGLVDLAPVEIWLYRAPVVEA